MTLSLSDELQDFRNSHTRIVCLIIPNTIRSSLSLSCLFDGVERHLATEQLSERVRQVTLEAVDNSVAMLMF